MARNQRRSLQEINSKIEAYKDALKQIELVHHFKKMTIEIIITIEQKIKKLEKEKDALNKREN